MTEPWQQPDMKKATVTVEADLYARVKGSFHYGQMTKLFRNLFETLDQMIKDDEIMLVVNYIYKNDSLKLFPVYEPKESDNERD